MKIHQYPYDPAVTDYPDTADVPVQPGQVAWPLISGQHHWRPANGNMDMTDVPQMMSPSLGHTHVELRAPVYAELTHDITIPFTLMLFQIAGRLDPMGIFSYLAGAVRWDTPDGQPPNMMGDPNGLMMWTGHISTQLSRAMGDGINTHDVPKHGWFSISFNARTYLDSGDRMDTLVQLPFFSMLDPTQPEVFFPQGGPRMRTDCMPSSPRDTPVNIFAEQSAECQTYLPILSPITGPIPQAVPFCYGYGAPIQFTGTGMTRRDMDLHHGNAGVLIASQSTADVSGGVSLPSPFDPAILGPGTHKVALIWEQDSAKGQQVPNPGGGMFIVSPNEQVNSLLVVSVNVGSVNPLHPTLTSVLPASVVQGASVPLTCQGTNFMAGATTVHISDAGVTVGAVTVVDPLHLTVMITVDPKAILGARSVTVATANGTSGSQVMTVTSSVPEWTTIASGPGWILNQSGSDPLDLEFCTGPNFAVCTPLRIIPAMM